MDVQADSFFFVLFFLFHKMHLHFCIFQFLTE